MNLANAGFFTEFLAQKERLEMLNKQGYRAVVCKGFDETVKTIKDYMET